MGEPLVFCRSDIPVRYCNTDILVRHVLTKIEIGLKPWIRGAAPNIHYLKVVAIDHPTFLVSEYQTGRASIQKGGQALISVVNTMVGYSIAPTFMWGIR